MTKDITPSSKKNTTTGSPQSGGPVYLTIGKLQRTHGVKGEILMEILTDFPERVVIDKTLFIGQKHDEYTVASVRPTGNKLLLSFEGLTDCDQVSILRNQLVYIKTEDANLLPEGEYYHHEIIGMEVVDENGNLVGSVAEIIVTGANDVYIVKTQDDELLLPAIRSVVLSIDQQSKKMIVRLPEWD